MKPFKILINAKAYPPVVGGVESYSEYVARAYLGAGHQPTVVTAFNGKVGWNDISYPEGTIRVFNTGGGSQPVVFAKMLAVTAWVRLTQRFDFLHATTWRAGLAVLPYRGKTPMVLTVHGQEVLSYPSILKPYMIKVLRSVDYLVTVSNVTMEAARSALFGSKPKGVWEVDFNGLSYLNEAKAFERPPLDPANIRIVSFARLVERKNIGGCLLALAKLRDEGITNFRYTIAGNGPLRPKIEQMVDDLKLRDVVTMAGFVKEEDVPDLYRNADIFLHPQTATDSGIHIEGFGLVIADAISFGAAAVVGKDGGPKDFVKHDERGLVVDGNSIDDIAAALKLLLTDSVTLDRLASKGRQWCLENLSWARHVEQILDFMKKDRLGV